MSATFCPACGTPVPGAAGAAAAPQGTTSTSSAPMSGIDALTKDSKAQSYWVNRFIALIIDGVLVFIPLVIITVVVAIFVAIGGLSPLGLFVGGAVSVLWSLLFVLYFTVTESMWGASFGKRFLHLKVVSSNGSNPTIAQAFIRNISKIYWLLLLLDVIVGLAVTKGYQQKYTDKLEGTSVVSSA